MTVPQDPRDDDALARWRESAVRAAGHAYETAHGREIDDESRGMRWSLSPRVALTAAGLIALILLVGWAVTRQPSAPSLAAVPSPTTASSSTPSADVAQLADGEASGAVGADAMVVHVSGEVAAPGLVELRDGERVADAIDRAGGALPDADLASVNLARVPQDGEQIDVPAVGDEAADADGGPVRLNSASLDQLETLPGVGPVTAQNIVSDREANGPYESLEDLQRVSGIGPALVARLDGLVTM
ncbi:ComEA family DNA-binding protein [Demequina sp. NBRC 110055]|uniref:ComEA family DNA-binding protein n=1 Tax=Demequina sp. NBRC 110055 TaxID=1570344 RepID=UPI000A073FB0|nr:ComEA family DNA-binding protein [Demequina sp. NBRC 110055]